MDRPTVLTILHDQYRPYRVNAKRQFSGWKFTTYAVLPLFAAAFVLLNFGKIESGYLDKFIAVLAIVAAVLTTLLTVTQSLVGSIRPITDPGKRIGAKLAKARLEVLRGLYTGISYTVLLLILSLVPTILVGIATLPDWAKQSFSFVVYFVCVSVAVLFFDIITGIYIVLDEQAADVASEMGGEGLSTPTKQPEPGDESAPHR